MNNLIQELKEYAKTNNVPIIQEAGLDFLVDTIRKYQVKSVLEIGTAIGYSAINMALAGAHVVTIERDLEMYKLALANIEKAGLQSQITVIFGDALEVFTKVSGQFDLVFIDAAKGQYQKFFEIYTKYLTPLGLVVCDNLDFHGLAQKESSELSRNLRSLMRKLNAFKEFLLNNSEYQTQVYHIGDGMSLSQKVR